MKKRAIIAMLCLMISGAIYAGEAEQAKPASVEPKDIPATTGVKQAPAPVPEPAKQEAPAKAAEKGSKFLLGEESKGVTVKGDGADMTFRIRLQPRYDFRDTMKASDGRSYVSGNDMYFRRMRLEMSGSLVTKSLSYSLAFSGDKWDAAGTNAVLKLYAATIGWEFCDEFSIRYGKTKLPYSRITLVPDQTLMLIELPSFTNPMTALFGQTDSYYQPAFAVKGKFLDGIIAYEAAVADGWQTGETLYAKGKYQGIDDSAATFVRKGIPLYVGRVEVSPPGMVEKKRADGQLGRGMHLTLGANIAAQKEITYAGDEVNSNKVNAGLKEDRLLAGYDLSFHYKGFAYLFEYATWTIHYTEEGRAAVAPKAYIVQAGYLVDNFNLNLEPCVRYEEFNEDSNLPDRKQRSTTLGLMWYLKGHSLKVGANWVQTRYEDSASGKLPDDAQKDTYQIQGQLYF